MATPHRGPVPDTPRTRSRRRQEVSEELNEAGPGDADVPILGSVRRTRARSSMATPHERHGTAPPTSSALRSGHRKTASFAGQPAFGLISSPTARATPRPDPRARSEAATPRATRHRAEANSSRRGSLAMIRLPAVEEGTPKRRRLVRHSLAAPGVDETTIQRRAEMVREVAQDCLVQFLRERGNGKGKEREADDRNRWNALQSLRTTYFFADTNSPLPLLSHVLASMDPGVAARLPLEEFQSVIATSNLVTFVWMILHPDEAGDLLPADEPEPKRKGRKSRRRALSTDDETEDGDEDWAEMARRVGRRNRMLMLAWKRFWMVVVPYEKRADPTAMELWLDFATFIALVWQRATIDPLSSLDTRLPALGDDSDLFSPSAITRYGQWEASYEDDEMSTDAEGSGTGPRDAGSRAKVAEEWRIMMEQREKELSRSSTKVLVRKHRPDLFLVNLIAFIRAELQGELDVLSPSQAGEYPPHDESTETDTTTPGAFERSDTEMDDQTQPGPAQADTLDWDLFDVVAEEVSSQADALAPRNTTTLSPKKRYSTTASPRKPNVNLQRGQDRTPRSVRQASILTGQPIPSSSFNWTARQPDAERIDFETDDRPARSDAHRNAVSTSGGRRRSMRDELLSRQPQLRRPRSDRAVSVLSIARSEKMTPPEKATSNYVPRMSLTSPFASPRPRQATSQSPRSHLRLSKTPLFDPPRRASRLRSAAFASDTDEKEDLDEEAETTPRASRIDQEVQGSFVLERGIFSLGPESIPAASSQAEAPTGADVIMDLDDLVPASEQLEPVVFDPASEWDDIVEDEDEDEGVHVGDDLDGLLPKEEDLQLIDPTLGVQLLGDILSSSVNDADDVGTSDDLADLMPTLDELAPLGVLADMTIGASWAADLESEADKEDTHDGAMSAADDLMPSEDQLSPLNPNELFSSTDQLQSPFPDFENDHARGEDVTADHRLDAANAIDLSEETDEEIEFVEMRSAGATTQPTNSQLAPRPTSQQAYITSRSYKTVRSDKFATPSDTTEDDDLAMREEDDRVEDGTLDEPADEESRRTPVDGSGDAERGIGSTPARQSAFGVERGHDSTVTPRPSGSGGTPRAGQVVPSSTRKPARASTVHEDEDPYMVDEDGSRLIQDNDFVLPPGWTMPPSNLHGRKISQVYAYSRVTGPRRWTKDEELLLYRTVQKVPLSEPYPLRVVWHLYGERGARDNRLQMFNPQHMKDKMRTIVDARCNQGKVVDGRARFWLPREDPRRIELEEEIEVAAEERQARLIAEARERREDQARTAASKKRKRASLATAKKAKGTGRKGRKSKSSKPADEQEDEEDELESEEGQDVDIKPQAAEEREQRARARAEKAAAHDPPVVSSADTRTATRASSLAGTVTSASARMPLQDGDSDDDVDDDDDEVDAGSAVGGATGSTGKALSGVKGKGTMGSASRQKRGVTRSLKSMGPPPPLRPSAPTSPPGPHKQLVVEIPMRRVSASAAPAERPAKQSTKQTAKRSKGAFRKATTPAAVASQADGPSSPSQGEHDTVAAAAADEADAEAAESLLPSAPDSPIVNFSATSRRVKPAEVTQEESETQTRAVIAQAMIRQKIINGK